MKVLKIFVTVFVIWGAISLLDNMLHLKKESQVTQELNNTRESLKECQDALINTEPLPEATADIFTESSLKELLLNTSYYIHPELADIIIEEVMEQGDKYNIPYLLLLGIIGVESDFNPTAKNNTAIGLMQINSKVWFGKGKENLIEMGIVSSKKDLYQPRKNIRAGSYIFNHYLNVCKGYKEEGRLAGLGWHSVWECGLGKYNGKNNKLYSKRVFEELGKYWLFLIS